MAEIMTGKMALLEMLKAEGVTHIFGNPGTSEAPIIDMLPDYPEFTYIMALQESVAVGMGEAYARATQKPSLVSLHVDSGLANGIALMLDALNSGTPMVVTSANYDIRKVVEGTTDLAELVKPVTKWSIQLTHPDQIPGAIRRAFNEANTHPKGPVYIGLTANALEDSAEMNIIPSRYTSDKIRPDLDSIEQAADSLIKAENPVLIVGDRVSDDDAVGEAVRLAEMLGLPAYQFRGAEVSFPTTHKQYLGILNLRNSANRESLKACDTVIAVGMNAFEELFYWGDVILNEESTLIHIDSSAVNIGKSEPTNIGIISHCKMGLQELNHNVSDKIRTIDSSIIEKRLQRTLDEKKYKQDSFVESTKNKWDDKPMSVARMMHEFVAGLPENAVVVDDSISNRAIVREYLEGIERGDIVGYRGQSIGGGIGVTMGAQCGYPDRKVFGLIGDGSAMMTVQGLWTAVNDNIPCVFVILNNGMYRVLKVNFNIYQQDILNVEPAGGSLPYSDFPSPFDMAAIAKSMGMESERITDPEDIKDAVVRASKLDKPVLLDIVIDGSL
ncbi:MAG: thiamine pyrophosphate-binding protein [SAR202 cluster bacterium]|nr:thiamine pyrophosphate-binding protein [SAR202 cluster bacterium]MQG52768.1 thiamine pyrophosphate-binding protein [SAR202 cluster bacterium]|tara:strand:- start:1496 stop:3163 length:1668 start_codon:yes stop_codon:yes gene_type:complete